MKVLLVNPRLREWSPNVWVPLGLTYVAAALEAHGHEIRIVDFNVDKFNENEFRGAVAEAQIVGITGLITEFDKVLNLARKAREADAAAKIVLGGPLATSFCREMLELSQADFAVLGEGEATIIELLAAIEHDRALSGVQGIAYRENGNVVINGARPSIADLDSLPFPARHLLDMKRYVRDHFRSFGLRIEGAGKIRSTNLITSRGCPYSCVYCYKEMWGYKWRARSPQNVVREMELLLETYGVNGFIFCDDIFVLNRKRVMEFCHELKEKDLGVIWYCNGRANLMTPELLKAMYEAGCRGIAYGIESGSQRILDLTTKGITLEQVRNAVRWTREAGIKATGYFMLGMLGETKATIADTIAFAKELGLDFYGFSITTPLPGTKLYSMAMEKGKIQGSMEALKDWGFHVNVNLTEDCSDQELEAFAREAFREFTIKKMSKSNLAREAARVVLSLQNMKEAGDFLSKAYRLFR